MNTKYWIQITSGQGPKECAWVAQQVCRRIQTAATKNKLSCELIECSAFDKRLRNQDLFEFDAIRSALLRVEGNEAGNFSRSWHGSILWRGESHFRPKHKRCNWYVAVICKKVAPMKEVRLEQLKKEVQFEAIRSSGPGGQHVNKTNSAVRLTHEPTGITLRVDNDRSQHRNRAIALERLELMLQNTETQHTQAIKQERWMNNTQIERGNPVRTFCGEVFKEE